MFSDPLEKHFFNCFLDIFHKGGGGVQGQKSWRPQTHWVPVGPRTFLGPKKSKMANKALNRDL